MKARHDQQRSLPMLRPEYCKGCLRCIETCPKHCITQSHDIHPLSGVVPVELDLTDCNACQLCIEACPEPYGLRPARPDPEIRSIRAARELPATRVALPPVQPALLKGTYAAALGALLAGCRHVFGYPITPSTEGAELMARVLPRIGGVFVQAVSEVAAVNMMYGCAGAGLPCMTFTSSPGLSLMLEGISYMIGAELPAVFVTIMRGGPGLGSITPEQSDLKLLARGLGHGNTHAITLAPSTPQEMMELTRAAFELAFRYRNPVIIAGDGHLGQMAGVVELPGSLTRPGLPGWAVWGGAAHRRNLISSIHLADTDLERHNLHLEAKYRSICVAEQRAERWRCEDARVLVIACNTPARMAKGAVQDLRALGVAAGLFRPITVWPFPVSSLLPLIPRTELIAVVEAGPGQLEDELRLALSHAGVRPPRILSIRRLGGVLPQRREIVAAIDAALGLAPIEPPDPTRTAVAS